MIARIIFTCCLFIHFLFVEAQKKERTISFGGYEWSVRNTTEKQGPGPNYFSDSCVRLDTKGWLHLWIKKDPASSISQLAMPVHINFWLFDGNPPADQNPVEIVIRSFQFIP